MMNCHRVCLWRRFRLIGLTLGILTAVSVPAEEGGSGHYVPGANADYLDALPGYPCLAIEDVFTYYGGDVAGNVALPVGGSTPLGLNAKAYSESLVGFYETPWTLLGGNYAAGIGVPYVWMNAKARIGHFTVEDSANGIGDIEVIPFMIGWTNGTDLKYDVRLDVYTPTGDYEKGALANPGKNYWTFEPVASISYVSSQIGLEVSAFAGLDFNTRNNATDYQSGDVFHLDATLAEHLPLLGGAVRLGREWILLSAIHRGQRRGRQPGRFRRPDRGRGTGALVCSQNREI